MLFGCDQVLVSLNREINSSHSRCGLSLKCYLVATRYLSTVKQKKCIDEGAIHFLHLDFVLTICNPVSFHLKQPNFTTVYSTRIHTMKLSISLLALGLVKQVCDCDCICYLCFFLASQH
jgi:hypothetical protein